MTRKELFERAHALVKARQQTAVLEMEKNRHKVIASIPEILELERTMQRSAVKISTFLLNQKASLQESVQQIMQENLLAQQQIEQLLVQHGYAKNTLDVQYTCNQCHDTGYIKGDHCHCVKLLMKQLATEEFNRCNAIGQLTTFDSFDLHYYCQNAQEHQTMQQIFGFCKEYAENFSPQSKSILMMGKTGLGKTHLSLAIAETVLGKGVQVLYGSAQDFFGKIQNEYFNRNKVETDTMAMVLDADLLILDDLGAEFESNFNTSTLYNIINGRLNAGRPTIVNTNLSLSEIQARYSDRIASRLLTVYSGLRFVGTDVRQQQYLQRKKR